MNEVPNQFFVTKKTLNRKKIKYRNTDKVKLGVGSLRAKEIIK